MYDGDAHSLASRDHPTRRVALVLGGQNPISLEYQIYPPAIDTLVTGWMEWLPYDFKIKLGLVIC